MVKKTSWIYFFSAQENISPMYKSTCLPLAPQAQTTGRTLIRPWKKRHEFCLRRMRTTVSKRWGQGTKQQLYYLLLYNSISLILDSVRSKSLK